MKRLLIILSVVLLSLLAGCFLEYSGPPNIYFDGEVTDMNGSATRVAGEVTAGVPREGYSYRGSSLCVYDGGERLLAEVSLGELPDDVSVNVTVSESPKYIIVYSPDFETERFSASYYVVSKADSGYRLRGPTVDSTSEFPVNPRESGCGS